MYKLLRVKRWSLKHDFLIKLQTIDTDKTDVFYIYYLIRGQFQPFKTLLLKYMHRCGQLLDGVFSIRMHNICKQHCVIDILPLSCTFSLKKQLFLISTYVRVKNQIMGRREGLRFLMLIGKQNRCLPMSQS